MKTDNNTEFMATLNYHIKSNKQNIFVMPISLLPVLPESVAKTKNVNPSSWLIMSMIA